MMVVWSGGDEYLKNSLLEQPEHEVELLEEKVTENAARTLTLVINFLHFPCQTASYYC